MEFPAVVLTKIQTQAKGKDQKIETSVLLVLDSPLFSDISLSTSLAVSGAANTSEEFRKFVESFQHGDSVKITITKQ